MNALKVAWISILFCSASFATSFKPAVIYDTAGKFDKSFNEAIYKGGVQPLVEKHGVKVREVSPKSETQIESGLTKLAKRGYQPIVAAGFSMKPHVEKVAKAFPDIQFTIIDAKIDLPNVQSILFKEHEGSFLVGALAALSSKSNKIGFIGGMDLPMIHKFACGYRQGAMYIKPDIALSQTMTGNTPMAFNDPAKGATLAKAQIQEGVDIIFAAAGSTGIGVYAAAKQGGIYAIGVDSNQNYMQPGTMLTSMLKKVGVATLQTWLEAQQGKWLAGVKVKGLKEDGVGWALDEHNRSLVSETMETQINGLKDKIISGEIKVHDYTENNECP